MDGKSGFGSAGDREMCAFKFSPLPCFFEFSAFILVDF